MLHADHRRLLIKAYTVAGIIFLFNAHALECHTYHVDKVRLWWADTERILEQHVPARFSCIWLIDANARVGEFPSSSVWKRHPDKQNMQGGLFHDLLERNAMCLPTTFATDACGSRTCVSLNGMERRIDYVAIPQQWLCYVQSASVDSNITLAIGDKLDHRLVRVDLRLPRDTECVYHRPAKATAFSSLHVLQLPARQAQVQKIWDEVPPTPAWLDH